jgi:hypothetical protein
LSPEARAHYFAAGRAAGYSDTQIEAEIAEVDRVAGLLDACKCPTCGAVLGRRRDPRQAGAHNVPGGVWYSYRCACGFSIDRAEPVNENLS